MNDTRDRRDTSLPVTGEVGGEGGSFADPAVQVATETGDLDRTDSDGDAEIASRPVRREPVTRHAAPGEISGAVKPPEE
jgi:hypothetical protein